MTREQVLEERCKRFRKIIRDILLDSYDVDAFIWNFNGVITDNDYRFLIGKEEIPEKPPLGVMPKDIWDRKRQKDLAEAMRRFLEANKYIPEEWLNEYNELCGDEPNLIKGLD